MLIDSFLINDELGMVEFRLQYLWSRVDHFVIVEGNKTFTGKEKPFYFQESFDKFEWAKEKIIYSPVMLIPDNNPWIIEAQQRNCIDLACHGLKNEDILMISDADEIPTHQAIKTAMGYQAHFPVTCDQSIVFYNLTNVNKNPWAGTVFANLGHVRNVGAQEIRSNRERYKVIRNGGYHLSYFGGADKIKNKIESFSHTECNKPEFTNLDHIRKTLETSGSLFGESHENCYKVGRDFYPNEFVKLAPESWWS